MKIRAFILTMAAALAMPAASWSQETMPESRPPAFSNNLTTGNDLAPFASLPEPRHVAINESCAQESLAGWTAPGIDGSLYAYELPPIAPGFASPVWNNADYLVLVGIEDRSPYEAHTNTDKIQRALQGSDELVPIVAGEPLVNVFLHGAFVSSAKLIPEPGLGFDVLFDDGTAESVGGRLTPLQTISQLDDSFTWGGETTISPACLANQASAQPEFQLGKQPVAVMAYQDFGRIHYRNGVNAEGPYLADVLQVRSQLGLLQALLSGSSPDPASVSQMVSSIEGSLSAFDSFDVEPPSRVALTQILDSLRTTTQLVDSYNVAYGDLDLAAKTADPQVELRYAIVARRLLSTMPGVTNTGDLTTTAENIIDNAQRMIAAREAAGRAAAVAADHQRMVTLQVEASSYSPEQRALILKKFGRMPDAIGVGALGGQTLATWRWGNRLYYFDHGTIVKFEDL